MKNMTDWALPTLKLLCRKSYTPPPQTSENMLQISNRQHSFKRDRESEQMFLQTASQQQQKIASTGEDAEKLESVQTLMVMLNGTALQESSLVIPPKVNIELTYDQAVSLPGTS